MMEGEETARDCGASGQDGDACGWVDKDAIVVGIIAFELSGFGRRLSCLLNMMTKR